MRFKIYTAHQITGLTPTQVLDYFGGIRDTLTELGFDVLQPMTGKGFFRVKTTQEEEFKSSGYVNPVSTDHAIYERDMWMVDTCDMVLLDFTGTTKPSIGMIIELSRAATLGKHTVIVMEKDNVHRHAFITQCADTIFETLPEALDYLKKLAAMEM